MAATDTWQLADIPDQAGRTVVVTGPSPGGIGFHAALELARRGARVVLAGRSPEKLNEARHAIVTEHAGALLEQLAVDLASLDSVRAAGEAAAAYGPVHVLINNAGVMATSRTTTPDGFDLQLATNHVGPFLLTGLLLPQLVAAGDARVVTVSSAAHRMARRAPTSFEPPSPYRKWQLYGQSKLANLLFTHELDRRARAAGLPVRALAAHPGFAGTHLLANGRGGGAAILDAAVRAVAQSPAAGAWPLLMAATADLPGTTYVGPGGLGELSGAPQVVTSSSLAQDPSAARHLWELSERATGISYP